MRLETTRTIDVSRDGLLVQRAEPCELDAWVWVTCPFDPTTAASSQPESPARVVRVEKGEEGGYHVALRLEPPPKTSARPPGQERRGSIRIPFSLPIFVRDTSSPWPEESMTQNISNTGVRFVTGRIFSPGDALLAKISWGEWAQEGEIPARVVWVETRENSSDTGGGERPSGLNPILTSVAARWERPPKGQMRR